MEIKIVKIGSSKGIRIPSKILKELDNPDMFDLNVTEYGLFLKPIKNDVRSGWKEAYSKSSSCSLDKKS